MTELGLGARQTRWKGDPSGGSGGHLEGLSRPAYSFGPKLTLTNLRNRTISGSNLRLYSRLIVAINQ